MFGDNIADILEYRHFRTDDALAATADDIGHARFAYQAYDQHVRDTQAQYDYPSRARLYIDYLSVDPWRADRNIIRLTVVQRTTDRAVMLEPPAPAPTAATLDAQLVAAVAQL